MRTFANIGPRGAVTPQSEPIPDSGQTQNNAGGYAWEIDDWGRLDRFLILGTDGGTYYVKERPLTIANAECVKRCIAADGQRISERPARPCAGTGTERARWRDGLLVSDALGVGEQDPRRYVRALHR